MITTVTLNPSIDKAYYLEKPMVPGTVMRVRETINNAGGKGINVAKNVKLCGAEVVATGFLGGFNGQYLEYLLAEKGIATSFTAVQAETRSCINVLESQYTSTEFLEAGAAIQASEVEAFLQNFQGLLARTQVVTISGSLPAGVPDDIYARLIEMTKEAGKQVILDSSGAAFKKGLEAKPTLIKPNEDEIAAYFGLSLETEEDILFHAKKFLEQGIDYVVVSLGGRGLSSSMARRFIMGFRQRFSLSIQLAVEIPWWLHWLSVCHKKKTLRNASAMPSQSVQPMLCPPSQATLSRRILTGFTRKFRWPS